ncbi:MAG: pro-sigmaK processing inhibitor BofA family protein [Clostridia bacterium]|nr:pro-sigmaK processing inhibitor BofA family protein [Clostridia bacterium]
MNLTVFILAAAGLATLVIAVKRIRPGAILLSAAAGLAALFGADIVLGFTHLNLPINVFTALCAAAGGIPGVILLLVLNAFLTI